MGSNKNDNWRGVWSVEEATLPNGQFAYTGSIDVAQAGDVFTLTWNISAGSYVGVGLAHGSHLYVSCGETYEGLGVALFSIQPDRSIKVLWNTPEMNCFVGSGESVGAEPETFEGTFCVNLRAPGAPLSGEWTFSIYRTGDVFEVRGKSSEEIEINGLGLPMQNGLAIGWYPNVSQLAFMDYQLDNNDLDKVTAVWALGGFSTLGTETLTRNK